MPNQAQAPILTVSDNPASPPVHEKTPKSMARPPLVHAAKGPIDLDAAAGFPYRPPPMSRYSLVLLLATITLEPLAAGAFEPGRATRESVLVLRHGGILVGQITPAGDRYMVVMGDQAEVRVPVRDVEMHCLDLDEVYLRKRSRLTGNDATGHLDLADWCLQHNLYSRAADELLSVIALHPRHPRLPGLERRLQLAVESPETYEPHARAQTLLVGLADLEKTSRSLPPGALEEFTSQIQPLLMNRCGANSCHGSASPSDFRLVRPTWTKTLSRRFTQRNLHAVMQRVDAEDAESSPLLTMPSCAHGGLETGVFGPREKDQFDLLVNWVRRATTVRTAPVPATIPEATDMPPTGLLQASYSQPVGLPRPARDASRPNPTLPAEPASQTPKSQLDTSGRFVPRDSFDAEIFNRRLHPDGHQRP